jgi:hypothetical protein
MNIHEIDNLDDETMKTYKPQISHHYLETFFPYVQTKSPICQNMNFWDAAQANPYRNVSYSVSVDSLSCQHCLSISPSSTALPYWSDIMKTALPSDIFLTDAIQFDEVKTTQSDCDCSFKLSLYATVKMSLLVM